MKKTVLMLIALERVFLHNRVVGEALNAGFLKLFQRAERLHSACSVV